MAPAWKVAESLEVLRRQLNALAPRRSTASDGSIGDAAHASRSSDHNPWWVLLGQPYVTARDFTHDPDGGLDCEWLAGRLRAHRDPRVKYVIWRRRIMAGDGGPSPWTWRAYSGSNPHDKHLHLSVVADARSLSGIAWRLDTPANSTGPIPIVEDDDVSPELERMIREIHRETATALPNRRGPQGQALAGQDGKAWAETLFGYAMNVDGATYRAAWELAGLHDRLETVEAMLRGISERTGGAAPGIDYDQLAAALLRRIAG